MSLFVGIIKKKKKYYSSVESKGYTIGNKTKLHGQPLVVEQCTRKYTVQQAIFKSARRKQAAIA